MGLESVFIHGKTLTTQATLSFSSKSICEETNSVIEQSCKK